MRRLALLCVLVLVLPAYAEDTPPASSGDRAEPDAPAGYRKNADATTSHRVQELREQINLLNLLNGLYLDDAQRVSLLGACHKADGVRTEYRERTNRTYEKLHATLEGLRKHMEKTGFDARREGDSRSIGRDVEKLEEELDTLRSAEEAALAEIECDVRENILTSNQLAIVENYASCLIPKKEMKDPTRIGQAGGGEAHYLADLDKARHAAPGEVNAILAGVLDQLSKKLEKHGTLMTAEERETEMKRLNAVVRKARELDDVEYELTRNDLALQLEEVAIGKPNPKAEARRKKEEAEAYKNRGDEMPCHLTKVGRFLLHPRMTAILVERIRHSTAFEKAPPVDLSEVEAAERCKDGTCGTDEPTQ